jgi:hypothetical protein
MTVEEQLAYEARVRTRQASIAAVAGLMLVGAAIIQLSGIHTKVDELTLDLITEHRRFPLDLIGAIVNSLGLVALALTLSYLYVATRARNPEIQTWIRWLALAGGVTSAVAAVIYAIVISTKASDFVSHGLQTYPEANHLTSNGLIVAIPLVAQFASLLLTAGFIWISLNAMRVGLLTRFMGYIGIFAGVLVLFPIGSPVPVVQGFWLLALAYLLAGRWPSGVPPAWSSGQAERWPTSAEQREARGGGGGGGGGGFGGGRQRGRAGAKPTAKTVSSTATDVVEDGAQARTRANTPKRKRKHRR